LFTYICFNVNACFREHSKETFPFCLENEMFPHCHLTKHVISWASFHYILHLAAEGSLVVRESSSVKIGQTQLGCHENGNLCWRSFEYYFQCKICMSADTSHKNRPQKPQPFLSLKRAVQLCISVHLLAFHHDEDWFDLCAVGRWVYDIESVS